MQRPILLILYLARPGQVYFLFYKTVTNKFKHSIALKADQYSFHNTKKSLHNSIGLH